MVYLMFAARLSALSVKNIITLKKEGIAYTGLRFCTITWIAFLRQPQL